MEAPARHVPVTTEPPRLDAGALFAMMHDAMFVGDLRERRILEANPAFLRLFGWTREETIGASTIRMHVDARAYEAFGASVLARAKPAESLVLEWSFRRADGTVFPAEITLTPVPNTTAAMCLLRDLTERKRVESALQEQVLVADTLQRISQSLTAELDLERVVQHATDAATKLTGAAFGAFFYNAVNERGESYSLYTISGVPREAFSRFPMPRNTAVFAPTFAGEGVVRSDDITKDARYGQNAPHHGMPAGHLPVRSYLAVPVTSRAGQVLGGMFFGHPEPGVFAPRAEQLAVGIAALAAIAIDNAHLYRRAKENEERLRERESQLAEAQRVAHLGSWSSDIPFGKLDWSDENYRIHGIPIGEPVTMDRMLAVVHPEDRERFLAESARVLERGEGAAEYRLRMSDGTIKHVHARGYVVRDAEGRPVRGFGTTLDVTERKNAELALQESEARFRTLVTATTQMVWSTDEQGMIRDMPEWRAFTGQSIEEVRGAGWVSAIHPDDRPRVRAAWVAAFQAKRVYESEYRVRSRDGEYRWFLARAVPRFGRDGALVEYIGTWTDVTDQRKALAEADGLRAQLAQSEKLSALGSLVGGVAHEIRTPLTYLFNNLAIIQSNVDRIVAALPPKEGKQLRDRLAERVADTLESVDRINRLVDDLRRYTKLRPAAPREVAPVSEVVRQATELFAATHRGQVEVETSLLPTPARSVDRVQIQQVVLNLLENALAAKPADGRVVVRTYARADDASVIEVQDSGVGIPTEVQARMWDPFFTTRRDGTGLGLSIVRRIVEVHGGSIACESAPGKGSLFRVTLP